ncbi:MAG: HAD-IIIC family phosphatase [bacterium]|nr:HAD-IIIC family phosphatase [bacterium]
MNVAAVSNINIESLAKRIKKEHDIYFPEGFGVWVQEIINPGSSLYASSPECLVVLLDGEELLRGISYESAEDVQQELAAAIGHIESAVQAHADISFFVSNLDIQPRDIKSVKEPRYERLIEGIWLEMLNGLNDRHENLYIFDIKRLIEESGRREFYSPKLWYLGGMRYSLKGEKLLKKEIGRYFNAHKGVRKKCLLLDLDNTMWGGIIGEDGMEGIQLSEQKEGARYKDFQRRIKEMKDQGTILAIVSKNNMEDALEVIENHPHMVLKKEDFAAMKINWNLKAQNIADLAEELNLGLDSFVFIDDNPVERDSVKSELPQVQVADFPEDTSEMELLATELSFDNFFYLKSSEEDKKKTEMYRQNAERATDMKSSASFEGFLKSLNSTIRVWSIKEQDILRAAQLTQKTNQFNLTTKRYTEKDIQDFINSEEYDIYISSVEDKYGDNGIISELILKKEGTTAVLDTFLMSCRVMGRFVEDQLIHFIHNRLKEEGFTKFRTHFYPTKKNKPVKDLFERLGYTVIEEDGDGNKTYEMDLTGTITCEHEYGEMVID